MATARLQFVPPDIDNLAKLLIYESATANGIFVLIDTIEDIGTYPEYITEVTTAEADDTGDWFALRWEDEGEGQTAITSAFKANDQPLIDQLIQRVQERDSTIDVRVIRQEAEAVIQMVLGDNVDPYDYDISVSYRVLNGMVYLVLARSMIVGLISSSQSSEVAIGLVRMKTAEASSSEKRIQQLIDLANDILGLSTSLILQMEAVRCNTVVTNILLA